MLGVGRGEHLRKGRFSLTNYAATRCPLIAACFAPQMSGRSCADHRVQSTARSLMATEGRHEFAADSV
jgi:hypothetical protein